MSILPQNIYRFNSISIRTPMTFFTELEQIILKCIQSHRKTQNSPHNIQKKNKFRSIMLHYIKLCHKAIVIKIAWYWCKSRHIEQQNRIESQEINPYLYLQLINDKGGKNIQWGKNNPFKNCYWKNWTDTCKKKKQYPLLTLYIIRNSKFIKDLNVRPKTIKILEENRQ